MDLLTVRVRAPEVCKFKENMYYALKQMRNEKTIMIGNKADRYISICR